MSRVMDPELYDAATTGSYNPESFNSFNLQQKTRVKENNALHLAAKFNRIDFVKKIDSQVMAQLMRQKNSKGDTPLHIAARYGRSEIIEFLADPAVNNTESSGDLEATAAAKNYIFVSWNDKEDTALHDAVRNGHFDAVKILMNKDLESTKLYNGVGDSPLFLAVDRNFFEIAKYITKKSPGCSCRGRGGMNVLHALVIRTCPVPHSEGLLELWINYSKHPTSIMFDILKESKSIWLKNIERIKSVWVTTNERIESVRFIVLWAIFLTTFILLVLPIFLLGALLSFFYLLLHFIWETLSSLVKCCCTEEEGETRYICLSIISSLWEKITDFFFVGWEVLVTLSEVLFSLSDVLDLMSEPDSSSVEAEFLPSLIEKFRVLIKESDDELQWTPLHFAAYLRHKEAVKTLLENDETKTVVYEQDKKGMSALHLAAKEGHVEITNYIIKRYPATCELLDTKDRTILHVAVKYGRYNLVKYILQSDHMEDLLNEQDQEGNTPLHYAAIHGHGSILKILVGDKRVDKGVFNKEGQVAHTYVSKMELRHFQKAYISSKMYKMGGQPTLKARESSPAEDNVMDRKNSSSGDVVLKEERKCRDIKEVGKNNILVITIMATVTFAVGFQIPGGIDDKGHSVSAQNGKLKYIFAAFQIANTLGFCFSLAAISTHFSASTEKECGVYRHFMRFASLLTYISIWSTGVSYIMGTHLVITQHPLLAAANLAIFGCSVFLTMLVWFMR